MRLLTKSLQDVGVHDLCIWLTLVVLMRLDSHDNINIDVHRVRGDICYLNLGEDLGDLLH